MQSVEISVNEINYLPRKGHNSGELSIEFLGKSVTRCLLNTIRRVIQDRTPSYSFFKDSIEIYENTSQHDNDKIRIRLSQMCPPIYKKISMYVTAENKSRDVMHVTTNDSVIMDEETDKEIKIFDEEYPNLLINLLPGEKFSCKATSIKGIGLDSGIWNPAHCFYKIDRNILVIRSFGQRTEYDLLKDACDIYKNLMKNIEQKIISKIEEDKDGKIVEDEINILIKEDHTIYFLQECLLLNPNVHYSVMQCPNFAERVMKIKYKSDNPISDLKDTIKYITAIFDKIGKLIKNKH